MAGAAASLARFLFTQASSAVENAAGMEPARRHHQQPKYILSIETCITLEESLTGVSGFQANTIIYIYILYLQLEEKRFLYNSSPPGQDSTQLLSYRADLIS